MLRKKKFGLAVVAVGAATVLLAGCASSPPAEERTTIRGSWISDPANLDPAKLVGVDDFRASRLLFDTLIRRDDDNQFATGLAEDWDVTPTSAEFTLKDGITCADGTPLTPSMVAASLSRLADPETGSAFRSLVFGDGEVTVAGDDDASTVRVDITAPYGDLLPGLTLPAAGIVCTPGLEDPEGLNSGAVEAAFTGPYTLKTRKPGVEYEFALREDYDAWPEYAVPLEGKPAQTLEFVVGSDLTTAASQLVTGDLEVASISIDDVDRVEAVAGTEVSTINVGAQFVVFNESPGSPFVDEEIRRAAAQVIDHEALQEIVNPRTQLILSTADPAVECVNQDESLLVPFDEKAAADVLVGVKIRFVVSLGFGPNGAGGEYIAEQLRAAGADVELANIDNAAWASQVLSPDGSTWDMTVMGTVDSMATMNSGLSRVMGKFLDDGGRNMARADNLEGLAAYQEARASSEPEERCDAYQTAQESALERVDFVPLVTNSLLVATSEGITLRSPSDREDYSTLRIVG